MSHRLRLAALAALTLTFAVAWSDRGAAAQFGYPPPYPYMYHYYGRIDGSIRIEVTPREAEVYVDGYYAGIVDDFDGVFQRLRVEPGEHAVTMYRDGYRPITEKIYVQPNTTFRIRRHMETLAAGEMAEPRPLPPLQERQRRPNPGLDPGPDSGRMPQPYPPDPRGPRLRGPDGPDGPDGPPPASNQSGNGRLTIHVEPADAEVVVDGQPWQLAGGQDRVVIDASPGRHNVQVRKAGYAGYLADVQVRRGDTTTLNVRLRALP